MDKRILLAACVVLVVISANLSCSRQPEQQQSNEPRLKKLLSRTDLILVKHWYPAGNLAKEEDQPKLTSVAYAPGVARIEPLWVYEPNKELEGTKGARISLTGASWSSGYGSRRGGEGCNSYLDLGEVKDMITAITFMSDGKAAWRNSTASDHVEVQFQTKDSSGLTAFMDLENKKPMVGIKCGTVAVFAPFDALQSGRQELQKAVDLLESKR